VGRPDLVRAAPHDGGRAPGDRRDRGPLRLPLRVASTAAWIAALPALLVAYLYLHYGFASMTAHVTALYPGFLAAALAAGAPPLLAAFGSPIIPTSTRASPTTAPGRSGVLRRGVRVPGNLVAGRVPGFAARPASSGSEEGCSGGSCSAGGEAGPVTEPQGRSLLPEAVERYVTRVIARETPVQARLRAETRRALPGPDADRPDQAAAARAAGAPDRGPPRARDRHLHRLQRARGRRGCCPPTGGSSPAT